jgi:hypothetical protein
MMAGDKSRYYSSDSRAQKTDEISFPKFLNILNKKNKNKQNKTNEGVKDNFETVAQHSTHSV